MIKGNEYYNGNMQLRYIDMIDEWHIFYRVNDNTFVLTSIITSNDGLCVSWCNGHYITDLKGVYGFLKERGVL